MKTLIFSIVLVNTLFSCKKEEVVIIKDDSINILYIGTFQGYLYDTPEIIPTEITFEGANLYEIEIVPSSDPRYSGRKKVLMNAEDVTSIVNAFSANEKIRVVIGYDYVEVQVGSEDQEKLLGVTYQVLPWY